MHHGSCVMEVGTRDKLSTASHTPSLWVTHPYLFMRISLCVHPMCLHMSPYVCLYVDVEVGTGDPSFALWVVCGGGGCQGHIMCCVRWRWVQKDGGGAVGDM